VRAAQAGAVVVQVTRAPRGTVPVQRFLAADGLLAGGDLAPPKLRIALMLAIAVDDASGGIDLPRLQARLLAL
jgi:L-asparaginase